jgi:beta-galactosidase
VTLDVRPDRDTIQADDTDVAFVSVTLVDTSGTVHHGADRELTVTIQGPAQLLGFGSGNPGTEESLVDAVHSTYHGRALAVLRPTGPARITLTVLAQECAPASTTVHALARPGDVVSAPHDPM